jgi:hypothetical integral membrane protein (TIGR02206 family)
MTPAPFVAYGPSHLCALGFTFCTSLAMVALSRRLSSSASFWQSGLAFALLLEWPFGLAAYAWSGDLSIQNGLPLHLCDVAAFAAAVGLLWRKTLAAELAYFFGLAGTLQGLLTPNLAYDFPHPRYFSFFLTHSSVVIAAATLVFGIGLRPRAWAVLRMMGWLSMYAVVVGMANAALGTNYGFLCAKPTVTSALDLLGPWPDYIAGIGVVAGIAFALLDLPFIWQRHRITRTLTTEK